MALSRHFSESHGNVNKPPIHEAYTVTFVEEPNSLSLDFCEDKWYHKLNAQINIKNMILPRVRLKKNLFLSAERWCVLIFAVSVHVFSFSSVAGFLSSPQRLGCYSDQMHVELTHCAVILNHNTCCFKPFQKSRPARSYIYLKATFSVGTFRSGVPIATLSVICASCSRVLLIAVVVGLWRLFTKKS